MTGVVKLESRIRKAKVVLCKSNQLIMGRKDIPRETIVY